MCESLQEFRWLYRGVPVESPEVQDVQSDGEVHPHRPGRTGSYYRQAHSAGMTDTGYTSWTTDPSFAEAAAEEKSNEEGLSGRGVIFRVRIAELELDDVFEGRADEEEYLIEGTVEGVEISENAGNEDDD